MDKAGFSYKSLSVVKLEYRHGNQNSGITSKIKVTALLLTEYLDLFIWLNLLRWLIPITQIGIWVKFTNAAPVSHFSTRAIMSNKPQCTTS